jgi:homoserine kinase
MQTITVSSPGTLSNLCCGFDILGMALQEPFDIIHVSKRSNPGISIHHKDTFGLPEDPNKNIAGVSLMAMIGMLDYKEGFDVVIEKKIKPGSGLGSSAASAAGVVVAANELLGNPLSYKELITLAMEGEAMASGSRHMDNVAPCILGGTVLIRDSSQMDVVKLNNPNLHISIVHPQIEIKTSYAREILPVEIPLKKAVIQWANVGGLIGGICMNDLKLIERSLVDVIIEPVRSKLIPGFDEVKQRALEAGAMGGGISGSGPSMFMFSQDEHTATCVAKEMQMVFEKLNVECKSYVTKPSSMGVQILESK